ncbi:TerC family protein [Parvibaculum sp.]|uniref:TerC family protein n=1 Tax=Parvibaculum sp. TaxID=2024848 RepID=UPI001B287B20|nr:TerC family protein [Parvibaculum sp.]MBO6678707.1 TerC family protein [Parvibaculum sp.]MBO6683933.1 TerC family protein [Parvibaculum sp.]MBO6905943.1 TerC family protein [Parvibaculum sp.]
MEVLLIDVLGKPLWTWAAFLTLIVLLLVFDLGVLHRKSHEIGVRESLALSAFYITIGSAFSLWVWQHLGEKAALDYLTGFVVEKSLALDNIFVIATIFAYFGVPRAYQHRVLIYGILGVILLRGLMIGAGAAVVTRFEWVLLLFAAFLIFTGVKMLRAGDAEYDVSANPVLRFIRRHFRVTDALHGERFFVRLPLRGSGKAALFATPLFLALVMVELADVIFAVDSIPAIFAITTDPYIVYTSNIFAILGLRALYFALSAMMHRFVYLKTALSLVLIFIGGKVFAAELLGIEKIPPALSLGVTLALLTGGICYSLWKTRAEPRKESRAD